MKVEQYVKSSLFFFFFFFLYPSGTSRGLITSGGSTILKLKTKSAQPSCVISNMTHRGKGCRLCDVIQKGGKPLLCDAEYDSEANIAIFCDVQSDSKRQTVPCCVKLKLIQRQALSYSVTLNMTQRGKLCHLQWC